MLSRQLRHTASYHTCYTKGYTKGHTKDHTWKSPGARVYARGGTLPLHSVTSAHEAGHWYAAPRELNTSQGSVLHRSVQARNMSQHGTIQREAIGQYC